MPALSSPTSKVLVTGPNGYIGLWVVKTLLDRGHTVRAAVRSETRAKDLKTLFSSAGDRLEFAIVEDMLKVRPVPSEAFSSWNVRPDWLSPL
jgi:uncharacterized protein YbjT (DUF2867 family)